MKPTKIFFLTICVAVMLATSCDNRFDFIPNSPPKIYFGGSKSQMDFIDSVKIVPDNSGGRTKGIGGDEFYILKVEGFDFESSISSINYRVVSGYAELFIDEELNGSIPLNNNIAEVKIKPGLGANTIEFSAGDEVGLSTSVELNLFAFDNLLPVAVFKYKITKIGGDYIVELDATGSFDQDSKFGGGITQYEYQINDIVPTIKTDKVVLPVDFPGAGGYTIKYRVYDNEGATSEWKKTEPFTL